METQRLEKLGGNSMSGLLQSVKKIVSLHLALVMVGPLVGGYLFSQNASSDDNRISFDVTIGSIGSLSFPGARKPMNARLEAVADSTIDSEYSSKTHTEESIKEPGPTEQKDGSGPTPMDSPFGLDILVYDDPNNQTNPSIDHDSSGNAYIAFEDTQGGDSDILVANSSNGGLTWNAASVANSGMNESCPSMAIDYSPIAGTEMWYVFYEADTFEYAWSDDGASWNREVIGWSSWSTVTCPYVVARGDFVVVVAQKYDDQITFQDTWYIIYTFDGFQTMTGYFWTMFNGAWVSGPRATIIDDDEVFVAFDIFDKSDPNPGNWSHDTELTQGILTGDLATDSWPLWIYGSGFNHQDYTSPSVASNGREVIFTQEVKDPAMNSMTSSALFCAWSSDLQDTSTNWSGCNNDSWYLAFDKNDIIDQKFPKLEGEGGDIYAVWLNGTDLNYRFSMDGGNIWISDPTTGDPMKVNEPGPGTALNMYHSPDITFFNGKPGVAWHDNRGNGSIYFQTFGHMVFMTFEISPRIWDLWIRKVGDGWRLPPYSFLCLQGSPLEIEVISVYEIPNETRYTFKEWDDGSTDNPRTFICSPSTHRALFNVEYWLTMINPGGITSPTSGYQPAGAIVTIEAFSPAAPPGARYIWLGWNGIGAGSYSGPLNPCTDCVVMNEKIQQIANWQLQWEVIFDTVPIGLNLEVNGVTYATPFSIWFNDSETHTINAPTPQGGGPGGQYEFSHWSDGGAQQHNISVMYSTTLIAYFILSNAVPGPPGVSGCELTGPQLEHVSVGWALSPDDGGGDGDVTSYEIYYGTVYDPSGSGYVLLDTLSAGSSSYVHVGGGHGDNRTYFYQICAVDGIDQRTCDVQQASKFSKHLDTGMQLLSIPLQLSETSTPQVFQTVSFTKVTYYDAMAGKRQNWKTYDTRKPYSTLKNVNRTMALWVDVSSVSWFTIAGLVPQQTTIHLVTGWNFVGYPSFIPEDVSTNLAGASWQNVESFDPANAPWFLQRLSGGDPMYPGEGYWIHVSSPFDWVLHN
jgi:hypothetical protein